VNLFAEQIDGPANIRKEPKGLKFISLYDKVEVTCTEIENDWYKIGFDVKLTKEQYEQSKITIPAGTKLYNIKGKLIGEALIDLTFSHKMMGGPKNNRWYGVEWTGYTFKSNIRPESIPEIELGELLMKYKGNLNKSQFKDYLKQHGFRDSGLLKRFDKGFEEYMIYENWIDDPSPMDRIRLIFKNEILIAIIHTRDIKVDYLQSDNLTRGRKMMMISKMTGEDSAAFWEMNVRSYDGVD